MIMHDCISPMLSKDSDNFQHHFMASNVLRPTIAQRAGPGPEEDVEDKTRSKAVPKDLDFDDLQVIAFHGFVRLKMQTPLEIHPV